uniref:Sulfate permease, SulP family n=1 Tax=Tetraselmis sp. GSL018 TaxID=582737 RepID=A0A061SCD8_9CHLO
MKPENGNGSSDRSTDEVSVSQQATQARLEVLQRGSHDRLVELDAPLEPREKSGLSLFSAGNLRLNYLERAKKFIINDYYVPRSNIVAELMAGLVVGLAVVPEAIAFALVAGIPPQTGVDTTLITSIVVGIFGDRPGLCNGASGAIAVVVVELVREYSIIYMGYCVILAGLICVVFAFLRMSKLVVYISASTMIGFVNGLAIIIFCAQFSGFKDKDQTPDPGRRLLAAFDVFVDGVPWIDPTTAGWMMLEIAIVMATMVGMGYIPFKWVKVIPGSLVGILLATAAEWAIVRPAGFSTRTIGDIGEMTGALPIPLWQRDYSPQELPPLDGKTLGIVMPYAGSLAAVALIEQLMTMELVNTMTKSDGNSHREAFGLGVGNIVAGCFGGMGGNAMIGQSVIQVRSGGTHRISNIVVGAVVLIISVAAFPFVNRIPQAAFIGMMWMIVYYTFEWNTFTLVWHAVAPMRTREKNNMFQKIKRVDVLVVLVVTIVTIFTNLAIAVGFGVAINLIAFAWDSSSKVRVTGTRDVESIDPSSGDIQTTRIYEIEGPLFFASARKFKKLFSITDDPDDVELHCTNMQVMDYSALEAISFVASEYAAIGKRLHLRFLKESTHRELAKGRGMLKDLASWRVFHEAGEQEVDMDDINLDHMQVIGEAKQKHYDQTASPAGKGSCSPPRRSREGAGEMGRAPSAPPVFRGENQA